jgi:hypothetical protein
MQTNHTQIRGSARTIDHIERYAWLYRLPYDRSVKIIRFRELPVRHLNAIRGILTTQEAS